MNVIFKKSKNKYGAVLSEYWIYRLREKFRLYDPEAVKVISEDVLEDIVEYNNFSMLCS